MRIDGLLPYQIDAVTHLCAVLGRHGGALDGSDMGTGKTYTAGGVMRHLDLPSLVVCPKVAETGWLRMGAYLGVEFDVLNYEMLRIGRTPFGTWGHPKPKKLSQRFKCLTCQCWVDDSTPGCPYHTSGIHCVELKSIPHDYGAFSFNPAVRFLVFDEVHRCGATNSLNSEMLIAARRQGIPTLALSATAGDSPLKFKGLGYLLGLHNLNRDCKFWPWVRRFNCRPSPHGGFYFAGDEEKRRQVMSRLNSEIFPDHGCRVRIKDLGDAFPECAVYPELYDLPQGDLLNRLYEEMESALQALKEAAAGDVCAEHPLTRLLRARQQVELLKVPAFVDLASDALAQGQSVVLFVNFTQTLNELCARLKTTCCIDGSQSQAARQNNVDRFQAGLDRLLVCNVACGGVSISLHDPRGDSPRCGFVSPCFSAVDFRQVLGRLRRQGGKSASQYRIVFAAKTVEEKVFKKVSAKLRQLDALLDGDLVP